MNLILAEKLAGDDTTLFNQGACHVFADELSRWLTIKGFRFRRLADQKMTSRQGNALHVYLAKGDRLVDVNGLQSEGDLIQKRHADRLPWNSNLQAVECTREEIFTPFPQADDPQCGVRNQWGLDLDAEFVEASRKRASQLISRQPEIYIPTD